MKGRNVNGQEKSRVRNSVPIPRRTSKHGDLRALRTTFRPLNISFMCIRINYGYINDENYVRIYTILIMYEYGRTYIHSNNLFENKNSRKKASLCILVFFRLTLSLEVPLIGDACQITCRYKRRL